MANLGTVAIVGLLGVGVYAYSKHRQKKDAQKKKTLKPKKPARVNNVELWTKMQDLPEPPFVGLIFCDNPGGRAILEVFTTIGRTFKGPKLFAISAQNVGEGPCPEGLPPAILASQRVTGAWLETIEGEDQEEFMLTFPDEDKIRVVLGWAAGEGELPLESATWIGEIDVFWKDPQVPQPPLELKVGVTYKLPIAPPDPTRWVEAASGDEAAVEVLGVDDPEEEGQPLVYLFTHQPADLVAITIDQNGWEKRTLVRVVE